MTIVNNMISYEFRLYPTKIQEIELNKQLHLTRELYNSCLAELIEHYKKTGKHMNLFAQDKLHGKKEHPEIPSPLVDTVIKRLHRSFDNFFRGLRNGKKYGFPRFKSANRWHTLQCRDSVNGIHGNSFHAPKMMGGKMRFNPHRAIDGKLKFCRIIRRPSGWYLQAVCDNQPIQLPKTGKEIGLDFGIKNLIADSNGEKVENPQTLKKSLRKLRRLQRILSRRKKGSNRRKKQARIVARHHERIANQRKDYLHKISRKYVNAYDKIYIENLSPTNMSRNGYLSRAIMDSSWYMLRNYLEYKAENAGKQVVAIPPKYTSQKCSQCGEIVQKSLSVRTHACPHCGYTDCRDVNAAKNILRLGQSLQGGVING